MLVITTGTIICSSYEINVTNELYVKVKDRTAKVVKQCIQNLNMVAEDVKSFLTTDSGRHSLQNVSDRILHFLQDKYEDNQWLVLIYKKGIEYRDQLKASKGFISVYGNEDIHATVLPLDNSAGQYDLPIEMVNLFYNFKPKHYIIDGRTVCSDSYSTENQFGRLQQAIGYLDDDLELVVTPTWSERTNDVLNDQDYSQSKHYYAISFTSTLNIQHDIDYVCRMACTHHHNGLAYNFGSYEFDHFLAYFKGIIAVPIRQRNYFNSFPALHPRLSGRRFRLKNAMNGLVVQAKHQSSKNGAWLTMGHPSSDDPSQIWRLLDGRLINDHDFCLKTTGWYAYQSECSKFTELTYVAGKLASHAWVKSTALTCSKPVWVKGPTGWHLVQNYGMSGCLATPNKDGGDNGHYLIHDHCEGSVNLFLIYDHSYGSHSRLIWRAIPVD